MHNILPVFHLFFPYMNFSFSIWVFFHDHSWITGLQGKGEDISLTPHYHFHPLHKNFDISQVITTERTGLELGTFDFQVQVANCQALRSLYELLKVHSQVWDNFYQLKAL